MLGSRAKHVRIWALATAIGVALAACSVVPTFVDDTLVDGGATGGASPAPASVCSTPSDCKGAESDCAHRTCEGQRCGQSFAPKNTPIGIQTAGDCQKTVCDGAGKVLLEVDPTDLPDDDDPCTLDTCVAGAPVHTAAAPGAMCGPTATCGSMSVCTGCNAATDCQSSTECVTVTCMANTCTFTNAPDGQAVAQGQTAGDCLVVVCNGVGGTKTIPDDSDHPADDADPCTQETCESGAPAHPPIPGLNDNNVCTDDVCTNGGAMITHTNFPDGTPCGGCDQCMSGVCKPASCAP